MADGETTVAVLSSSEGVKWTKDATLQLISLIKTNYSRLESGVKKFVYIGIAKEINYTHNLNLSYDKVESKWKGLKKTYKKIKEDNNKTGHARKCWEFYDAIDDILFRAPEINPPAVLSTEDDSITMRESQDEQDFLEESCSSNFVTNFRKRRRRNVESEREAATERRHAEKMTATNKFLDLFQQLIDKM